MWLSNYSYCFAFCGCNRCTYFARACICSCSVHLTWLVLILFVVHTLHTYYFVVFFFFFFLTSFFACIICLRFHFEYFMQHEIEIRFDVYSLIARSRGRFRFNSFLRVHFLAKQLENDLHFHSQCHSIWTPG